MRSPGSIGWPSLESPHPRRTLPEVVPDRCLTPVNGDRLPSDRDWGTAAAVTASVLGGAHIVRVHAVREMADVVRVADRLRAAAHARHLSSGSRKHSTAHSLRLSEA